MERIQANGMEKIDDFVKRLLVAAKDGRVEGKFNSSVIVVTPGMSFDDAYEQWDLPVRRSYFGQSEKFKTRDN